MDTPTAILISQIPLAIGIAIVGIFAIIELQKLRKMLEKSLKIKKEFK